MNSQEEVIKKLIQEFNLQTEDDLIFCKKVATRMGCEFAGYNINVVKFFENKIPNTNNLKAPVQIQDIHFLSHCLHHMTPIIGTISVHYIPGRWLIGFSRIIDCINTFTKRLQIQENLTIEVAKCIFVNLEALYVKVEISARHYCMQSIPNELPPLVNTLHEISTESK